MSNLIDRHQHIINQLKKEGSITVAHLCKKLKVSSVTIRKDLKLLEDKQLLFRTHGGATLTNPYVGDKPVQEKALLQSAEKNILGAAAAALIDQDDCILIASGTTVQAVARNIKPKGTLTAITASLQVALELLQLPNTEVIQLGGILRKTSSSVVGAYAENALKDFSCSKLFLGVDGIDLDFGLTTTNMMEAGLNKKMIETAQKTIVVADSSKFGRRGFGKICEIGEIEHVITDNKVSKHIIEKLTGLGIAVTLVNV